MSNKPAKDVRAFKARIPTPLFTRIEEFNQTRPHLSMNALIVEMLEDGLAQEEAKKKEGGDQRS